MHWLKSVERKTALALGWPVWQCGQRFYWVDAADVLFEAETAAFDLTAQTVECASWPEGDFLGSLLARDHFTMQIVTVDQILAGWAEYRRRRDAVQAAHDARRRAEKLEATGGVEQLSMFA